MGGWFESGAVMRKDGPKLFFCKVQSGVDTFGGTG
jgi:hypothetical protein